ncbi:MAG: hypothetical protein ACKVYV_18800 [Limisphaerales bacterium]
MPRPLKAKPPNAGNVSGYSAHWQEAVNLLAELGAPPGWGRKEAELLISVLVRNRRDDSELKAWYEKKLPKILKKGMPLTPKMEKSLKQEAKRRIENDRARGDLLPRLTLEAPNIVAKFLEKFGNRRSVVAEVAAMLVHSPVLWEAHVRGNGDHDGALYLLKCCGLDVSAKKFSEAKAVAARMLEDDPTVLRTLRSVAHPMSWKELRAWQMIFKNQRRRSDLKSSGNVKPL